MVWFTTVLLVKTNEAVWASGAYAPVTFGELLRYLGMRLLMATSPGWAPDKFWNYNDSSTTPMNQENNACPYNLRGFMSMGQFKRFNSSLPSQMP
jgi:hypothetical protein